MILGGEKRSQKWRVMLRWKKIEWATNLMRSPPSKILFSHQILSMLRLIHHQIWALKHLPDGTIFYILTKLPHLSPHHTLWSFTLSSTLYFSYNYIYNLVIYSLTYKLYTNPNSVWIIFVWNITSTVIFKITIKYFLGLSSYCSLTNDIYMFLPITLCYPIKPCL